MTTVATTIALLGAFLTAAFFALRNTRSSGEADATVRHQVENEQAATKATEAQLAQARESQAIERDVSVPSDEDLRKELRTWSKG